MSSSVDIKNKKAKYEYEYLETFTAGIQLKGTEIKSIRNNKASIAAVSYTHLTLPTKRSV